MACPGGAWGASTTPAYDGDFPDPYVARAPDGTYHAYSTQVGSMNVPMMRSSDLATWEPPSDALPNLPAWAAWGRTWAPAVARRGSTWVMWYTTHHAAWDIQCISVATATSPAGPFNDRSTRPLICQDRDHNAALNLAALVGAVTGTGSGPGTGQGDLANGRGDERSMGSPRCSSTNRQDGTGPAPDKTVTAARQREAPEPVLVGSDR